jgi:hypothetical protein
MKALTERPISSKRARKLRKRGENVYWSKHLESMVWVGNEINLTR